MKETKRTENERLAHKLRSLRSRTGLSQSKVSAMMGINPTSLCQYERGRKAPNLDTMERMANYYGVPVEYLKGADISLEDHRLSGTNLRALRKDLGLSQGNVAKAIGINQQSLCSYEAGRENYLGKQKARMVYEYLIGLAPSHKAEEKSEPTKAPDKQEKTEEPMIPRKDAAIMVTRAEIKKMVMECLREILTDGIAKDLQSMREAS